MSREESLGANLYSSPATDGPGERSEHGRTARRKKASRARSRVAQLTGRQEEVLRLVATGLTNKEVAAQLGLSVHTIESHLHSLYGKIGVFTRGAAIRFAVDHHLIEPTSMEDMNES
ncbi:MAG: response regulator transcription factor [Chloroflexia bacterium]|jgi:DNA-binding CsgD family transcriptional regulator